MAIANVSEIVGRRDLVKEAQGWAQLRLQREEARRKQQEARQKARPKPYNFELAEFGTNNESMLALQEDLNNQVYNYAMANVDVLSLDPRSEECGPNCRQAHLTLANMKNAAAVFNTYGDDLKSRYDALAELMVKDPDNYDNPENQQKLEDMKNVWRQGMGGETFNFTFNNQGRLVVNSRSRKKQHKIQTDPSGQPIVDENGENIKLYLDAEGNETPDINLAVRDRDGNPIPIMADVDTGQDSDFDSRQLGFGDWLNSLGFNDRVSNVGQGNFQTTVGQYEKLIRTNINGNPIEDLSIQALEAYIFGGNGTWNDNAGVGNLNSHSKYLEQLVRQEKGEDHVITKADILQKAYDLGIGVKRQSSGPGGPGGYDLAVTDISGYKYNQDLIYDDETSFNIDDNKQAEGYKDVSQQNYVFEGGAYDTGEQGVIKFKVDLKPGNVTMIDGDNRFQQVKSDVQLSSYNKQVEFQGAQYGVALFYKGKAISTQDYQNLSDEEKTKAKYRVALYGNMVLPSQDKEKLDRLGINYTVDSGDNLLVKTIVPAEAYKTQIGGRGSGDRNDVLIRNVDARRLQLQQEKEAQENQAKPGGDNEDPLNILN
tara:strand:- start:1176 stop:2966 length:1791 start_codon:yes stop_codon:yes gene_type:complete